MESHPYNHREPNLFYIYELNNGYFHYEDWRGLLLLLSNSKCHQTKILHCKGMFSFSKNQFVLEMVGEG